MDFLFDLYAVGTGLKVLAVTGYIAIFAFVFFAIVGFITTIKFLFFRKKKKSKSDREQEWLRTGKF